MDVAVREPRYNEPRERGQRAEITQPELRQD